MVVWKCNTIRVCAFTQQLCLKRIFNCYFFPAQKKIQILTFLRLLGRMLALRIYSEYGLHFLDLSYSLPASSILSYCSPHPPIHGANCSA